MRNEVVKFLTPLLCLSAIACSNPNSGLVPPTQTKSKPIIKVTDPNAVRNCIESVCGPAKLNRSGNEIDNARPKAPALFGRLWKNEFLPGVRDVAETEVDVDNELMRAFQEIERSGLPDTEQQSESRSFIAVKMIYGRLMKNLNLVAKIKEDGSLLLDDAKMKELFAESGIRKLAREFFDTFMAPRLRIFALGKNAPSDLFAQRKALNFPDDSSGEGLRKDAAGLLAQVDQIRERHGPGMLSLLGVGGQALRIFQKASRGEALSSIEAMLYAKRAADVDLCFYSVVRAPTYSAIIGDLRIFTKKTINTTPLAVLLPRTQDSAGRVVDYVSKRCEKIFGLTLALDAKAVRNTELAVSVVKAAAVDVANSYTEDEALRQRLKTKIENIQFTFAERAKDRLKAFRYELSERAGMEKEEFEIIHKRSPGWARLVLSEVLDRYARLQSEVTGGRLPIIQSCEALANVLPNDQTSTNGQIIVSAFTAVTPELTIPILAHEVGHVVSLAMRKEIIGGSKSPVFESALTCIANRNPFVTDVKVLTVTEDTKWSEEDLADRFSKRVVKAIERSNAAAVGHLKNIGCGLVYQKEGTYLNENSLSPAIDDPHSSPFMRLLLTSSDGGNVTDACQPFIDQIKATGRELKCE